MVRHAFLTRMGGICVLVQPGAQVRFAAALKRARRNASVDVPPGMGRALREFGHGLLG